MARLPLVSVIVPVYNTGDTLNDTIRSLLKQTYKSFEIIVVNDGSNDSLTVDKLKKLSKDIKVINQNNKGLPAARNTGIANSNGKYIICLDSDDCLNKKYIEKVVDKFEKTNDKTVAIVSSYVQAFGISNEQWEVPEFSVEKIKYSNVLPVASAFTKESWRLVGGYDESFNKGFEDWDFWLSIVEKGYSWTLIKEPIFYYRRKKTSMISDSNSHRQAINLKIISKHSSLYGKEDKAAVLDKMVTAEQARNIHDLSLALRVKKAFSKNTLKRFGIFR
jgi:glycosyltransferase involved in cell wall biosynthesis